MGDRCAACGLPIVAMPDGAPGCPYCASTETRQLARAVDWGDHDIATARAMELDAEVAERRLRELPPQLQSATIAAASTREQRRRPVAHGEVVKDDRGVPVVVWKGRGVGAGVYTEREWALASPSQRVEILRRLIARAHVEAMEGDHAGAERTLEHASEIAGQSIPLPGDRDLSGELAGLRWGEARNAPEATEATEACSIRPGCAGRREHAGPCCDAEGNTLGGW